MSTTINHVVNSQSQCVGFKASKKNVSEILKKGIFKDIKILDDSVFVPYSSLSTEDKKLLQKCYIKDCLDFEIQTRLMNELMQGNKDFVAGAKEYLAKNSAKDIYKK